MDIGYAIFDRLVLDTLGDKNMAENIMAAKSNGEKPPNVTFPSK